MTDTVKKYQKFIRPAIFTGLIVLLLLLGRHFGWTKLLSGSDGFAALKSLVRQNLARAILLYCVMTIVGCVVFALPGITFAVLAGVAFGPLLGTICCSLATTVGAGLAFLVGRFFLQDSLKPVVMKNRYLKKWLFDEPEQNAGFLLMITRLVPLFPYNLQNFAYGITDISFGRYLFYSCIFMLPGTAAYTIGSAGLADSRHRAAYFMTAAVLAAAVTLLGRWIKRRYVKQKPAELPKTACNSCGICTARCEFLRRHALDFSAPTEFSRLADHCFLCGECTRICPQKVDGAACIQAARRENVRQNGGKFSGLSAMRLEKTNYLFRNWRNAHSKSVLFPGCSYPSYYPQTTKRLMALLGTRGIGTVFDCCGKPIAELGLAEQEEKILGRLRENLRKNGVEEIITVCPNCYDFLRSKLNVRVVNIYEKLTELGIGMPVSGDNLKIFRPCPDRAEGIWLRDMAGFLPAHYSSLKNAQCCGLGGGAAAKEPAAAKAMLEAVRGELNGEALYVYCASCAGQFARGGMEPLHLLNEILGSTERADVKHSVCNRASFQWYRGR